MRRHLRVELGREKTLLSVYAFPDAGRPASRPERTHPMTKKILPAAFADAALSRRRMTAPGNNKSSLTRTQSISRDRISKNARAPQSEIHHHVVRLPAFKTAYCPATAHPPGNPVRKLHRKRKRTRARPRTPRRPSAPIRLPDSMHKALHWTLMPRWIQEGAASSMTRPLQDIQAGGRRSKSDTAPTINVSGMVL